MKLREIYERVGAVNNLKDKGLEVFYSVRLWSLVDETQPVKKYDNLVEILQVITRSKSGHRLNWL